MAVLPVVGAARLGAQDAAPSGAVGGRAEVFVGSAIEDYLRYLQTLGIVRPHPWSVRAFSPGELDAMLPDTAAHPWRHRYDLRGRTQREARRGPGAPVVDYVRPAATLRYNSGFPYGGNDGAVWAGRGLTTAVQAGIAVRWRGLSVTLAPVAFRAENAAFPLADNGALGDARFNDLAFPTAVDHPRRFGEGAYTRIDPGESTVRLDAFGFSAGASTASQGWGPADRYPKVLGNNAGGYPHLFVGTSRSLDLWIVRVHGRAVWGTLAQSPVSPVTGPREYQTLAEPGRDRFTSGLVAVVQPRGLPWVEVGASRFFHTPWRRGGPTRRDVLLPLQGIFKDELSSGTDGDTGSDVDNQLGSLFTRLVLPRSGYELFAELLRDDHNYDLRDLVLEPAQNAGYTIGVRKAHLRRDGQLLAVRAEVTSHEPQQLAMGRAQGAIYAHAFLRQGHTYRGQLLAGEAGVGSGAASTVAAELYSTHGRWTAQWTRTLRQVRDTRSGGEIIPPATATDPRARDVMHALTLERRLFLGALDVTAGAAAVLDLNRELLNDRFNASATLGVRYGF